MGALADIKADALDLVWFGEVDVGDGIVPIAMAGDIESAGPPLVLLHGWTLDWRMWLPQLAALSQRHFLVMPDRRGFGRSTAPPDLAREADDIQRIADFLGLETFALLGLSQGASIALDYAHRHAWRLCCVIASGAPLSNLVPRDEVIDIEQYEAWAKAGDMDAMRTDWSRHELMRHENPQTSALVDTILADYDGRDLLSPSSARSVPTDALAHLPVPLLAMTGDGDTNWRRECARALADKALRGSHAEVEGAGHLANLDQPEAFNRIIGDYLDLCAARRAEKDNQ